MPRRLDSSKQNQGFTLLEVIIAMTIFTLVIAGALMGLQRGFQMVDSARHYTRSSQVLQSELELLRTLPWATLVTQNNGTLTQKFNEQITEQFGAGVYEGTVLTDLVATDKLEIKVSVRWGDLSGRSNEASYVTYFTKGGVNDYYIN